VLEQKLASVVAASAPEGSLSTRAGLDRLRQEPANAAGFQTLAGLATSPSLADKGMDSVLAALSGNMVPILGRGQGQSAAIAGSPGPSGRVQVHVPAQLFKDVAVAVATRQR
jgi:hypothetical protein